MGTVEAQLSQFAHIRACCQAMVAGTQLLLWREDGFHLRSVRLRSVPTHIRGLRGSVCRR